MCNFWHWLARFKVEVNRSSWTRKRKSCWNFHFLRNVVFSLKEVLKVHLRTRILEKRCDKDSNHLIKTSYFEPEPFAKVGSQFLETKCLQNPIHPGAITVLWASVIASHVAFCREDLSKMRILDSIKTEQWFKFPFELRLLNPIYVKTINISNCKGIWAKNVILVLAG